MEQQVPGASAPPSPPADPSQVPAQQAALDQSAGDSSTTANPEEGKPEQQERKDHTPPWMRRQLTKARDRAVAAETRAQLLEQRLQLIEQRLSGDQPASDDSGFRNAPDPTQRQQREQHVDPAEIRATIEERVAFDMKCNDAFDKGTKEFGGAFEENLEALKSVGINERALRVIVDADEPHKVLNYLGSNPEEAERIFDLPPVQMARALGRIEAAMNAPKPPPKASNAPEPVKPVGARAGGTAAPSDRDDVQTWMAKRNAQLASRGGR